MTNTEERTMIGHDTTEIRSSRPRVSRPVWWLLLVVCAVCTMVTSMSDLHCLVGAGFGPAAGGCAAALIVRHHADRRR
ncbi:hypothetical protein ACWEPC_34270 [Nonomuraea sp. NPDC004297]